MIVFKNRYLSLIILFGIVQSIIPILTRNIIPYDMIENLYWGKEWQLGYAKHPPLFAWISYIFFRICNSIPESLYILTQLNLLLGFYFIFKIAKLIGFNEEKSYGSILFFMCSVASVFGNEKFNATTILMSLLPMVFYYFLRMIKFCTIADAICVGMIASLAFLGKYFALLFLGCMGIFLIIDRSSRKLLLTPIPYIALAVFLLGISWHIKWIIENHFITLSYALEKSINAHENYLSALNFLIMIFLFFGTSFAVLRYVYGKQYKIIPYNWTILNSAQKFVVFITILPITILFLVSLITGMRIGSFWCTNMLMLLGIYFFILNPTINYDKLYEVTKKIVSVFFVILFLKLGIGRQIIQHYDVTEAINPRKVCFYIENRWYNKFDNKKISIIRADKPTACLHIYLESSPSFYNSKNLDQYKIFEEYKNELSLVTFLCKGKSDEKIQNFINIYNDDILEYDFIHVIDDSFIYFAFVKGRNEN